MRYLYRIFIVLSCQFVVYTSLLAQDSLVIQPRLFVGLKGGVTVSRIASTPAVGTSTIPKDAVQGLIGGLVVQHFVQRNPGVQAELNMVQRGWTEPDSLYERQSTYLELPFMTHINIGKGNFKFFINAGPYAAFLLSEKETIPSGRTSPYYGRPADKKLEYGLCGGGGFSLELNVGKFELEGRYSNALSNIFTTDILATSLNQGMQGAVSYSIRLSKTKRVKIPPVVPLEENR